MKGGPQCMWLWRAFWQPAAVSSSVTTSESQVPNNFLKKSILLQHPPVHEEDLGKQNFPRCRWSRPNHRPRSCCSNSSRTWWSDLWVFLPKLPELVLLWIFLRARAAGWMSSSWSSQLYVCFVGMGAFLWVLWDDISRGSDGYGRFPHKILPNSRKEQEQSELQRQWLLQIQQPRTASFHLLALPCSSCGQFLRIFHHTAVG